MESAMRSFFLTTGKLSCVILIAWIIDGFYPAFSQSGSEPVNVIVVETNRIRSESSSARRTDDAQRLADWVRENKAKVVDLADIELIAGLLTDKDDSVRYWAAMALGYIGPPAQSAVPALEKALEDKKCDRSSKTSASAITIALTKIGVTPKKVQCESL
jgi:HEAT repeats